MFDISNLLGLLADTIQEDIVAGLRSTKGEERNGYRNSLSTLLNKDLGTH